MLWGMSGLIKKDDDHAYPSGEPISWPPNVKLQRSDQVGARKLIISGSVERAHIPHLKAQTM